MKRLLLAVALLVGMFGVAYAEVDGNPDRVPSIGLNYTYEGLDGERKYTSSGVSFTQKGIYETGLFALDTRIPLSRNWTINGAFGGSVAHWGYDETNLLDYEDNDHSGTFFNIGIRYYIH